MPSNPVITSFVPDPDAPLGIPGMRFFVSGGTPPYIAIYASGVTYSANNNGPYINLGSSTFSTPTDFAVRYSGVAEYFDAVRVKDSSLAYSNTINLQYQTQAYFASIQAVNVIRVVFNSGVLPAPPDVANTTNVNNWFCYHSSIYDGKPSSVVRVNDYTYDITYTIKAVPLVFIAGSIILADSSPCKIKIGNPALVVPAVNVESVIPSDTALVAYPEISSNFNFVDYSFDGGSSFLFQDQGSSISEKNLNQNTTYSFTARRRYSYTSVYLGSAVGAWNPAISVSTQQMLTELTPENASISVAYNPVLYTGGPAISRYDYTLNDGVSYASMGLVNPYSVAGLTNGNSYTVKIRAGYISGTYKTGEFSSPLSAIAGIAPSVPTINSVLPGATSLTVGYTAPSSQGTNPITRYEYSLDEGATFFSSGLTNPYTIEGLTTSQLYSITLRAVSIVGAGPWSPPEAGMPGLAPSAPTIASVLPAGDGTLSVAYTAPSSDGGAAITAYEYSLDGGSTTISADFPLNPFFITGLVNGTTYSIVIRAINSIGDGAWSAPVQGTPLAVPSEPIIDIVTAENGALSIAYTSPVSDGGSPITSYQYSLDGGMNVVSVGLTNPLPISGLTNGQLYTIILRAVNVAGSGPWSTPVYAMPASGQKVFALGDRFVRVAFDSTKSAPVHVSSTGEKDILNPRSWNVLQTYSDRSGGRVLTGLSVKQLDNWTYELLVLQPFLREGSEYKDVDYGAVHVSGTGQVSLTIAFEDATDDIINQNFSISTASVNASNTAKAVSRGYALKDIANVSISAPGTLENEVYSEFVGGTLVPNSAGDYAIMSGEALLRKLIVRRLISSNGDFFHLSGYGAGLAIKGVFSTANLPTMAKDIERQVQQEPDVEKAKVTLTYQSANSILVVQVQARMRSTGQQVGLSMSLPLGGVKSF